MNLGEFIIKIGTQADIKGLDNAIKKMSAAEKKTRRQIKLMRDLAKATSEEEKDLIKKNAAQQEELNQLNEAKDKQVELTTSINQGIMTTLKMVGAISATVFALDRLGNSLLKNNQYFITFEKQTGVSINRLNRMAGIARMASMNLSTEQVAGDIQQLQKMIFGFERFGENAKTFGMLGINPRGMKADQLILGLRNSLKGYDEQVKSYYLNQLGLSQEWLNVLDLADKDFKEYLKDANELQLTEKERKELAKYTAQQQKNNMRWELAKQRLIKAVMPLTIKIMNFVSSIALSISNAVDKVMEVINSNPVWLTILRDILIMFTGAAFLKSIGALIGIVKTITGLGIGGLIAGAGSKTLGKGAGGFLTKLGLGKILGKAGAKFAARQGVVAGAGAATGGTAVPWLEAIFVLWGLWDIGKAIYDTMQQENKEEDEDNTISDAISNNSIYQYRNLNNNMTNNFYNNPQPAKETVEELRYVYSLLTAERFM